MKIGIMTFQDANNYGAVLQAYALKKNASKYSDCEIINYYNAYFHRNENIRGIKAYIAKALFGRATKKKNKEFDLFREKYLKLSDRYVTSDGLVDLNGRYDAFVAGSDQVWNPSCSGDNDAYFLDFVKDNNRKSSFSASFGAAEPKLDDRHIKLIKSFKNISVREESGLKYLKSLGIDSIKTVDPVFLLEASEWGKLIDKTEEKYIVVYEVVNGINMVNFAKRLSSMTGYKVKVITSSNKPIFGVESIRDAGPLAWLSLMYNAEYVVTNSFHGLAFSLIFNKQFFIEPLSKTSSNNRMTELLDSLKIDDRIVDLSEEKKYDIINYRGVNEKMEKYRKESDVYIKKIVGEY